MNEVAVQPGDSVRVLKHVTAPILYPFDHYTVAESDGWVVVSLNKGKASGITMSLSLVKMMDNGEHRHTSVDLAHVELVEKGEGRFIPGKSVPFSLTELKKQRFDKFRRELAMAIRQKLEQGFEGYSNAATHLAALYLRQEPKWVNSWAPAMRRQDGRINPKKVRKAFKDLNLKVDDWAYECPIEIPDEFKVGWYDVEIRQWLGAFRVNWEEVADEFAQEVPA